MPYFGQLVIGPPGSGKTTYSFAIREYYQHFNRHTCIVNLDPANDLIPEKFDIDIRNLITLHDVETEFSLGPNSSFLYCFSFLENNLSWLTEQIEKNVKNGKKYFIFDSPGQIEIFTLSKAFKNIVKFLTNDTKNGGLDMKLTVVNLIESNNLLDMPKYIFSIFSVLNAMINIELPQVNIISKIDLLTELQYDQSESNKLAFPMNVYKNPLDSEKFIEHLNECNINPKYKKLNKLITEFVLDYGLVSFDVLDVKNQKRLNKIATLIDKANGYIYLDTGSIKDEKYIELRNEIAKHDFNNEDDEDEDC